MPVDVQLNTFLRNAVRRDLQLPRPQILGLELPFPEDTDDDTIRLFREAGAVPSPKDAATAARRAAQDAARRAAAPPSVGFWLSTLSIGAVPGSTWFAGVLGPFSFPYTIRSLTYTIANVNAAGTSALQRGAILVSGSDGLELATLQADTNVILASGSIIDGISNLAIQTTGTNVTSATIPLDFAVEFEPTFIKFLSQTPAGLTNFQPIINIAELTRLLVPGARFVPPIGRININLNTAPAPRRGTRTATPRGAVISVTQGGTILNQRTIAWESLRAPIRADWFNRQVGGVGDPSIRWIP